MIGINIGCSGDALPVAEFVEEVFRREIELVCFQDNSAVITICGQGYSPKLRHHRINLSSLYETFSNGSAKLLYIKTDHQKADPMTKPLPVSKWRESRLGAFGRRGSKSLEAPIFH